MQHPVGGLVTPDIRVPDVEPEAPVIEDLNPEYVRDGFLVVEECPLRQRCTGLVQRTAAPCLADLPEGNVTLAVDQIYQPDVSLEKILCHSINVLTQTYSFLLTKHGSEEQHCDTQWYGRLSMVQSYQRECVKIFIEGWLLSTTGFCKACRCCDDASRYRYLCVRNRTGHNSPNQLYSLWKRTRQ